MPKPISTLYLFPVYETREAYEQATGQPCPAWNPYRQPKGWFDPAARQNPSRRVIYDRAMVLADNGSPTWNDEGDLIIDALVLDREEAATVNIPPRGTGMTNVPGADVAEVPAPMRDLLDGETIKPSRPLSIPTVYLASELMPVGEDASGFTGADRALLKAIATKLGA
jgi:hypothetical protein